MIPYTNFLYFGILLLVVVPSILLGILIRNRIFRLWALLVTIAMVIVQYWHTPFTFFSVTLDELYVLGGYIVYQLMLAQLFLALSKVGKHPIMSTLFVLLSLAPLLLTKFIPFFAPGSAFGFLGISYLTFRSLDVILGIHNGTITALSWIQYPIYLAFFPTISSGPIDRYQRFIQDWNHSRSFTEFLADIDSLIDHVFRGFLYKFILAELIRQYWLDPVSTGSNVTSMVSYMYAYSAYLFFDFAGYSAFAVGISALFGVHTPENFNLPFLARNIKDFWDRWHISLSSWFRDHIYTPFVFTAIKGKWFPNKYVASYLAYVITMGLMGLWHGFTWYYIAYGLYHAVLLISFDLWSRFRKKFTRSDAPPTAQAPSASLIPSIGTGFAILLTSQFVCFGLLLFSGRLPSPF